MILNLYTLRPSNFIFSLLWTFSIAIPQFSNAQNPKTIPVVEKMYEKKEVKKPVTVEEWVFEEKNKPKHFEKLSNKTFTVVYPNCFNLTPIGDEEGDGVTGSFAVSFSASDKCKNDLKAEDFKSIRIGRTFDVQDENLDQISVPGRLLLEKKLKINGVLAVFMSSVMDYCTDNGCEPELRNHIYFICKKKSYNIMAAAKPGKASIDLIEKDNYDLPKVFKTMVSSFKCI